MAFLLNWDQTGEKFYETGVDRAVIYPMTSGAYGDGEAWNGLIGVTESPSGAEPTALYANNHKYAELMSAEEFGGTIEAYTYPDGFAECDGSKELVSGSGVMLRQQVRKPFGMTYRTLIGNDSDGTAKGYKIHIVYNALVSPSERAHTSINDSPEAETMSWEFTTTPVEVEGFKPVAHIEIDSTKATANALAALEAKLYGTSGTTGTGGTNAVQASLPTPAELKTIFSSSNT